MCCSARLGLCAPAHAANAVEEMDLYDGGQHCRREYVRPTLSEALPLIHTSRGDDWMGAPLRLCYFRRNRPRPPPHPHPQTSLPPHRSRLQQQITGASEPLCGEHEPPNPECRVFHLSLPRRVGVGCPLSPFSSTSVITLTSQRPSNGKNYECPGEQAELVGSSLTVDMPDPIIPHSGRRGPG